MRRRLFLRRPRAQTSPPFHVHPPIRPSSTLLRSLTCAVSSALRYVWARGNTLHWPRRRDHSRTSVPNCLRRTSFSSAPQDGADAESRSSSFMRAHTSIGLFGCPPLSFNEKINCKGCAHTFLWVCPTPHSRKESTRFGGRGLVRRVRTPERLHAVPPPARLRPPCAPLAPHLPLSSLCHHLVRVHPLFGGCRATNCAGRNAPCAGKLGIGGGVGGRVSLGTRYRPDVSRALLWDCNGRDRRSRAQNERKMSDPQSGLKSSLVRLPHVAFESRLPTTPPSSIPPHPPPLSLSRGDRALSLGPHQGAALRSS